MKKITWLFMSLMLFLGLGTASAQTLPDPTFTPTGNNVSAAPGQTITFTKPSVDFNDYTMGMVVLCYGFDVSGQLKPTTAELTNIMMYIQSNGTQGSKPAAYEVIGLDEDGWSGSVMIPTDASGMVEFKARYAALGEDEDEMSVAIYSELVEASYIVQGEAVKPAMPTFNPASGSEITAGSTVAISAEEEYILYCIDCEDADVSWEGYQNNKCDFYGNPIKMMQNATIKAVALAGMTQAGPSAVSDVASATYTVTGGEGLFPTLTITPSESPVMVPGTITFSCTMDPQNYTHASDKVGFVINIENVANIAALEYQVGETVDPDGEWKAYDKTKMIGLQPDAYIAAIPDANGNPNNNRAIAIASTTVHYRMTLNDGTSAKITFSVLECNAYGNISMTSDVLTTATPLQFESSVVPAILPDQSDIKFIPYPKEDTPEKIAKGSFESVWLRPVNKTDEVYYRILSVDGADQTAPISRDDTKVGTKNGDFVPIHLTEELVNAKGQFVVKAAALNMDGEWSENVTAAYNVVFLEHISAINLAFVDGEPTEFMVGESYEMKLGMTAPEDSLTRYGNADVNLIINWDGGIDFAKVEYKFADAEAWTAVDDEDLQDLIRIPGKFSNFAEKDILLKFTFSRKMWSDEMSIMMGIAQGYSYIDSKVLSSVIELNVPCVDRPAAMPTFSPEAGYIEKGSAVTISCATPGASIRYTTDGTEPTATTGTLYENPVTINGSTTLKAIGVKDGQTSFVSEAVYSVVGIPQITPASGWATYDSLVNITLNPATEGAKIYYTTDGTEPSASSTEYTAPFKLRATTLKVIAIKDADQSSVVTREYKLRPAAPVATPKAGKIPYGSKVKLECATEGAEIYWRIGGGYSPISTSDTRYTEEIEIKESCQLKAIAYYNGEASQQVTFSYTVTLSSPEFSVPEGRVEAGTKVTLSSKSKDANTNPDIQVHIAYTTDGSDPDRNSTEYTEPIEITETVTIKAITWTVRVQGLEVSEIASATYTVGEDPVVVPDTVKAPTFTPAGGEVEKGTKVTIACETENAVIYYTVDGSEPTAESTEYTAEISIDSAMTIKAIAVKEGMENSKVAEAVYTIKKEVDPSANEGLELQGVSIYPNPSEGMFYIELPVDAMVEVFATNGALVRSFTATAGKATLNLDRSGIYFVRIMGEGRSTVKRVIVR